VRAMRDRRDDLTLDLLDWAAPDVVPQVPAGLVRAGTLRGRMARVVSLVLKECPTPREQIAELMSEFLGEGETVSKSMLDAYASQAREEHTISAIRLVALAHATGDMRAMQVLVEPLEHAVIHTRYLPAIDAELKGEAAAKLEARAKELRLEVDSARRQWKGVRK
jgi:hypothetical protein